MSGYPKKEQGAALIISVLLLLVALMLSLSGMQSSRTGESMAGNYRAAERALMAAEYGASFVAKEVLENGVEGISISALTEILNDYDETVLDKYHSVAEDGAAYYRIYFDTSEVAGESVIALVSEGVVAAGNPGDTGSEIVARRGIEFLFDVDIGISSALSFMCPNGFRVPSNASGVEDDEQEEIDGVRRLRPAIAAGSKKQAAFITAEVLGLTGKDATPDSYTLSQLETMIQNSGKAIYMDRTGIGYGSGETGVYHAKGYIRIVEDVPQVDFSMTGQQGKDACKTQGKGAGSNPMCNYKGGISAEYGASILGDKEAFHRFIEIVMNDEGSQYQPMITANNSAPTAYDGTNVQVYSRGDHHFFSGPSGFVESFDRGGLFFSEDLAGSLLNLEAGESADGFYTWGSGGGVGAKLDSNALEDFVLYKPVMQNGLPGGDRELVRYFPTSHDFYSLDPYIFNQEDGEISAVIVDEEGNPVGKESNAIFDGSSVSGLSRSLHKFGNNLEATGVVSEESRGSVMIVDGNVDFGTSPDFSGILIILGSFGISGGGTGEFSGAVFVVPYHFDHLTGEYKCDDVSYDADGGGNFKVTFDARAVQNAFEMLPSEARDAWVMGGSVRGVISSWRERY